MKQKMLLDCDPGCDDMFALLWALMLHREGTIELVGITTSWWNVWAHATYLNALRACALMQVHIPVGRSHITIDAPDAAHIHGQDGMWWLSSMLPDVMTTDHDSIDMLTSIDADLILCTWPMTNLALAHARKPWILKKIIAMGWSFSWWNITPTAEFNIAYDPTSAKIVCESGADIILIPLDVTQSFVFGMDDLNRILTHVNDDLKRNFITKLTEFTIGTNQWFRETHYKQWFFVHDAHTIWCALYSHLYRGRFVDVLVETTWEYSKGQTITDTRNNPRPLSRTFVVTDVVREDFLDVMTQDFKKYDFSV